MKLKMKMKQIVLKFARPQIKMGKVDKWNNGKMAMHKKLFEYLIKKGNFFSSLLFTFSIVLEFSVHFTKLFM